MVCKVLSITSMTGFGMVPLESGLVFGSMFVINPLNKGEGKAYEDEYSLDNCVLRRFTIKNGDLSAACNVLSGMRKALPFPHRQHQNVPVLCSEVGKSVFRLRMSYPPVAKGRVYIRSSRLWLGKDPPGYILRNLMNQYKCCNIHG